MKREATQIAELSKLIDAALELPPEARSTWIEQLDAAHDTLKPALRKLLASTASNQSFTLGDVSGQVQAALHGAVSSAESIELKDGARVGPYELTRELGRGGMGTVWLARRTEGLTRREVALKLPHPGLLHAEFAARMGRERDILESLTHPNIARLYDAGVAPNGQPYLALEFVEGVPINEYCDRKRLGLRERIKLFAQVLQAIQYAHSNLVIHRDLKPANILVNGSGNAVVLDFGIAKLLVEGSTAETALTQFGGRALTPDYASPEQIAGAALTTASDVYSLGVILYELLTGERPYKLKRGSAGALEEAILSADVRRPSQAGTDEEKAQARATNSRKLAAALRGDLDTIVLTAMRAKLAERYRTVDALALDIANYLDGRAIQARPESWWESSRRFVTRHKLAVGSAVVVVLALTGGIAAATWQAEKARASEQRAIASAATSDAVKNFMIGIFQTNTLRQEDAAAARQMNALQLLEANANRLEAQFKNDPVLYRELLTTITRLLGESRSTEYDKHVFELLPLLEKFPDTDVERADLYHELTIGAQGKDPKAGLEYANKGLAILGTANDPPHRKGRAGLLQAVAKAKEQAGDLDGGLASLMEAKKLYEDGFTNTAEYGHVLDDLGFRELRKENIAAAIEYLEGAMRAYKADPTSFQRTIAQGYGSLSVAHTARKQYAAAEKDLLHAAELFRKDYGSEDHETGLAEARAAKAAAMQTHYDDAIPRLRAALAILNKPSPNAVYDYLVAAHEYLADALVQSGRLEEAVPEVKRSLEVSAKGSAVAQPGPIMTAADLEAMLGHDSRAVEYARDSLAKAEKVFGIDGKRTLRARIRLGRVFVFVGKPDEADSLFMAVIKADAANEGVIDSSWMTASVQHAKLMIRRGQAAAAIPLLTDALKKQQAAPADQQDLNDEFEYRFALGRALLAANRAAEALPHLERTLALRQTQYVQSPKLAEAQIALAGCKLSLGDRAGAVALAGKARAIQAANKELGDYYRKPLRELDAALAKSSAS